MDNLPKMYKIHLQCIWLSTLLLECACRKKYSSYNSLTKVYCTKCTGTVYRCHKKPGRAQTIMDKDDRQWADALEKGL